MQSDTLAEEREFKLRSIELEQISAKALLEISAKLDKIIDQLTAGESPARHPGDWWLNGWRRS
jgi:hypothetical protein